MLDYVFIDGRGVQTQYLLEPVIEWIKSRKISQVALQFPQDVMIIAAKVVMILQREIGYVPLIISDSAYADCCVDVSAAKRLNADGVVHFGHACMTAVPDSLPVYYSCGKRCLNVGMFSDMFHEQFKIFDKVAIFYDVEYAHLDVKIREALRPRFRYLHIAQVCAGEVRKVPGDIERAGRILSLIEDENLEDYAILYIGDDGPSLYNVTLAYPCKIVYHYDPYGTNEINEYDISKCKHLKRRLYLVEKAKQAQTLGIIVNMLGIKESVDAVVRVRRLAEVTGKRCYSLIVGLPSVEKMANFPHVDIFVQIACTETIIMDKKKYFRPIVTLYELELACNANCTFHTKYYPEFRFILQGDPENQDIQPSMENIIDFSLVTGQGHVAHSELVPGDYDTSEGVVAVRTAREICAQQTALSQRFAEMSWRGLVPNVGNTDVTLATRGRSGVPSSYNTDRETLEGTGSHDNGQVALDTSGWSGAPSSYVTERETLEDTESCDNGEVAQATSGWSGVLSSYNTEKETIEDFASCENGQAVQATSGSPEDPSAYNTDNETIGDIASQHKGKVAKATSGQSEVPSSHDSDWETIEDTVSSNNGQAAQATSGRSEVLSGYVADKESVEDTASQDNELVAQATSGRSDVPSGNDAERETLEDTARHDTGQDNK